MYVECTLVACKCGLRISDIHSELSQCYAGLCNQINQRQGSALRCCCLCFLQLRHCLSHWAKLVHKKSIRSWEWPCMSYQKSTCFQVSELPVWGKIVWNWMLWINYTISDNKWHKNILGNRPGILFTEPWEWERLVKDCDILSGAAAHSDTQRQQKSLLTPALRVCPHHQCLQVLWLLVSWCMMLFSSLTKRPCQLIKTRNISQLNTTWTHTHTYII